MARRATYRGKGEFLDGIPARHLSDDEFTALSAEQRKAVREAKRGDGSALYEVASERAARSEAPPAPPTKE